LFFFSKWESIRFPRWDNEQAPRTNYKNIDSFFAIIISSGKATLKELKESYSLEDAYILWEVITVTKYNEFLAIEEANKANR
jgi:hypothetical protein